MKIDTRTNRPSKEMKQWKNKCMNKLNDEQIHWKGVAHAIAVMAQKIIDNEM
jgi:hypothetical protein